MSGALKWFDGTIWNYVKGIKGDKGDAGPPSVGLTTLTSDYDQSIRQTGPRGGPYQLLFRRNRELYLNDRNDVDATGATDMASTIATYLSEFAAGPTGAKLHVYCESGSTYKVNSTIDVPAYMYLTGPLSSAQYQSTGAATFVAGVDGVTIFRLTGKGSSLRGLKIDHAQRPNVVGVRPNGAVQTIEKCLFYASAATATGVKGGGPLYFTFRENIFSGGWNGRGIDLLNSYADPPGAYYGTNVCWIERNIFAGHGAIRASGIFTIRDNDFEGGVGTTGAPAVIELAQNDMNVLATIDANYFEIAGASAVLANAGGVTLTFTRNQVYGTTATTGTFGVKFNGYSYNSVIEDNLLRCDTGIVWGGVTDSTSPGVRIGFNQYFVNTKVSGIPGPGNNNGGANYPENGMALIHDPLSGLRVINTAIVGTLRRPTTEATLYLNRANTWQMWYATPTTVTPQSGTAIPGTAFTMYFQTANVTLPNASWNLLSGADETPAAGTSKHFLVDISGIVREVGPKAKAPAVKTAAFTADASADTYLCDATSAAFTVTLPSAATWTGGPLTVKKTDSSANAVTVGTTSSQTIDGATTLVLRTSGHAVTVRPSAGNWQTVATTPGAHLTSSGGTPAIAAGAGAGTTPTVSISGADTAGTITVTTGTSPAASATVATITFTASYGTTPKSILIDPCGVNSAALTGTGRVYEDQASRTATTFALKVGSTALAASTTYTFSYQTIG